MHSLVAISPEEASEGGCVSCHKTDLVGESVVVEQFHDDEGAELLRWLEESHQQGGFHKVPDKPVREAKANEEVMCGHAVVLTLHLVAAKTQIHCNRD